MRRDETNHRSIASDVLCDLRVMNTSSDTPFSTSRGKPLAVGLVHRPSGTPGPDRSWARSLVVRQARAEGLTLLHVYEFDGDEARNADVLRRLAEAARNAGATVLVTDGLEAVAARRIADELGLRHAPVPPVPERGDRW